MKKYSIGKRVAGTILIPGCTFLIFAILCAVNGSAFIASAGHVQLLFRSIATVSLTSYALSLNLNSGRFDFSLGSMALLSSVISASITVAHGYGPGVMMAISIGVGLLLGIVSGLLYVLLKLPAIITSLGVTLMYEALAFMITDGKGVSFGTQKHLTAISSNVLFMIVVIVAAIIVMTLIFDHTKFGYNYNALKSGQKVAVSIGIKEIPNAVICYMIAGALMGAQGYITACVSGSIQMALNFGTIGTMFTAFLPMFIGGFIGRFINGHIGMVLGATTSAFISLGFVRLGISTEIQSLVSAFVLVIFLIYLNNEYQILSFFMKHHAEKKTAKN